MAVFTQHVALLGQMQDKALTLFETGEGTRYGDYPCFHQIMAEDSEHVGRGIRADESTSCRLAGPRGQARGGIDVLDAGCGRGLALIELARTFPGAGSWAWTSARTRSTTRASRPGMRDSNVTFEVRDLTGYREPGRFDLITSFDAVHDQKDPRRWFAA
jgi:2-polyprenyl-3-methyl-5-hydroxy-6-metoxy-1,4-benzoquinol methylase